MRKYLLKVLALCALVSVVALTRCSGGGPGPGGGSGGANIGSDVSLIARFKGARKLAKSDFERKLWDRVIDRGKITQVDYEATFNRYRQCAKDAGIKESYSKRPDGTYEITPDSQYDSSDKATKKYMKITGDCADQSGLMRVEALYNTQMHNPNLLKDSRKIVVQCLIKAGLVSGDYTVQDFEHDTKAWKHAPYDPMSPRAQKCLHAGGYAVDIGK